MDELIQQLTKQLGIDPSVAKTATSAAMAMVKKQAGDDLFSKIAGAIPGATESAKDGEASTPSGGGGGLLGSLAEMASSALGGSAGKSLELGAALKNAGVDSDKLGGFITMIINFIKEKVGDEVTDQLLAKYPILKSLIS